MTVTDPLFARHEKNCRLRFAAECAVPIECEHGYDVCPTCDPCTCGRPTCECIEHDATGTGSVVCGRTAHFIMRGIDGHPAVCELHRDSFNDGDEPELIREGTP